MAQKTAPDPIAKIKSDISFCQSKYNGLADDARLAGIRDEVEDFETKTRLLPLRIAEVRNKGYVFGRNMEETAGQLRQQWLSLAPGVKAEVDRQSSRLEVEYRALAPLMQQLSARSASLPAATPLLNQTKSGLDMLEGRINSAKTTIHGLFDEFSAAYNKLNAELLRINRVIELFAEATFQLLATEAPINAVKATWKVNGKEVEGDPVGILYLSDQRLFFEQKEEIATKKVLFITTEKQKVHALLFEFPVALVEQMRTEKEGFFKNEDHLELKLASGGPYPVVHFHLDGQDCRQWHAQVSKVKGGITKMTAQQPFQRR